MAIIIEAAHQPRIAFPGDTGGVEAAGHLVEEAARLVGQIGVDVRRAIGDRAIARILGVEDAQRVLRQPVDAFFRQLATMRLEMGDQRGAPGFAAFRVAQRVEVEGHAFRHAQLTQQLVGQHQQLDIGRRLARAQDFGVELVELAEAALLRALVTEQRTMGRDLQRRILLPTLGNIGARDAGGEFGAQGDAVAAAILERVHFLRHDVGAFAQRTGEHRGRFKDGHFNPLESIEFAHPVKGGDDMGEAFLKRLRRAAQHVLRSAHRARRFDLRHGAAPLTIIAAQGNALFMAA